MARYKYKFLTGEQELTTGVLNALGYEGWELVTIQQNPADGRKFTLVLKKKIPWYKKK